MSNRQIRLAARPRGEVKPSDWEHAEEPERAPGEGEFAARTLAVSLDPAMRGEQDRPTRRFVDAPRFHSDEAVFDEIEPADAIVMSKLVEPRQKRCRG